MPAVQGKRRSSFTPRQKLDVLDAVGDPPGVARAVREFFPDLRPAVYTSGRKLVESWLRERATLEERCKGGKGADKKKTRLKGVGTRLPAEAEDKLVVWVNDLRKEGGPVSTLMLRLEALDLAIEYNAENFVASWSWSAGLTAATNSQCEHGHAKTKNLQGSSIRCQLSSQRESKIRCKILVLQKFTTAIRQYLPTRTINKKGSKTVWVKCAGKSKERATAMLLGNSEGVKYRPFVVFKTEPSKVSKTFQENQRLRNDFGRRIWEDVGPASREQKLEIYGNRAGWWSNYLSMKFLKYHFGARPDMTLPILLLWDDFSGHWTEEVISYARSINVLLLKIPPSTTSVSQPADVVWSCPFKERLRACWVADLREQLRAHTPGTPFSMRAPKRSVMAKWIREAWDGLTNEMIARGYSKCYGNLVEDSDVVAAVVSEHGSFLLLSHSFTHNTRLARKDLTRSGNRI